MGRAVLGRLCVGERAAVPAEQTAAERAGDDLHATVVGRGIVERQPQRDQRIAVEAPHIARILVPRQHRALLGGLVHDHRAEDRHRGVRRTCVRTPRARPAGGALRGTGRRARAPGSCGTSWWARAAWPRPPGGRRSRRPCRAGTRSRGSRRRRRRDRRHVEPTPPRCRRRSPDRAMRPRRDRTASRTPHRAFTEARRVHSAEVHALTIVARNYLPQSRVLARTFLEHHPGARFSTLVIDGTEHDRAASEVGEVLLIDDIGLDTAEWRPMAAMYTVMEFATALKPAALLHLLRTCVADGEAVAYIDPDIQVMTEFTDVFDHAVEHGIALTPHLLQPLPRDGCTPDERVFMQAGLFNLGFVCVGHRGRAVPAVVARSSAHRRRRRPRQRPVHRSTVGRLGPVAVPSRGRARSGPQRRLLEHPRASAQPRGRRHRARRRRSTALLPLQWVRPGAAVATVEARRGPSSRPARVPIRC